jgi:alkyldihydroxyacetonephosphate synthase
VSEGPSGKVEAEAQAVETIARRGGAAPGSPEAVTHWLRERNHVPTFHVFLENGMVVDTIEVAATWDRIGKVYEAATRGLSEVPGVLAGTAHSSHVYRSGINLYFTFAARPEKREDMAGTYAACWRAVIQATADAGGGVSHHHGIGRVRRDWLRTELGDAGLAALRAVKRALDPTGFMNPGALLPE